MRSTHFNIEFAIDFLLSNFCLDFSLRYILNIFLSFVRIGALPVDPVDRINEIEDDIDNLDAIEDISGEAKFYRTSTEGFDDFVPPLVVSTDNDGDANSDTNNNNVNEMKNWVPEKKIPYETETTEQPVIDGSQFIDLLKIFAEIGGFNVAETNENEQQGNDNADNDVESKTELSADNDTTTSDAISDGTTETYVPRTLKRPAISQTVKDVLQAFKTLHNWRYTK